MTASTSSSSILPRSETASPPVARTLGIPLLALLIVGASVFVVSTRWDLWIGQATIQTTDNAYVRAEMTRISSRVAGAVTKLSVRDFQTVKAGDLLMEIDPADYAVQVQQAEASVAGAAAALDNLKNQLALQEATIAQVVAQRGSLAARETQAGQEQDRQQALVQSNYASRQKVESSIADYAKAKSDLLASDAAIAAQHRQLDVLNGTRKQREAELKAAEASLAAARLRLGYTRIEAPFDGVVGERQVQDGDYVTLGTSLLAVVPLPNVYVTANYKETQLTDVASGQRVTLTVDTFPGETLHGAVDRIAPASGSQFALLPPDNATGNFTKVVQRIPVRISLDPDQPILQKLRPGMSVVTSIDTSSSKPARR